MVARIGEEIGAHGRVARQGKNYRKNYKPTPPCKAYMSSGPRAWLGHGRIPPVVKTMNLPPLGTRERWPWAISAARDMQKPPFPGGSFLWLNGEGVFEFFHARFQVIGRCGREAFVDHAGQVVDGGDWVFRHMSSSITGPQGVSMALQPPS
jgi:hypothetical protein